MDHHSELVLSTPTYWSHFYFSLDSINYSWYLIFIKNYPFIYKKNFWILNKFFNFSKYSLISPLKKYNPQFNLTKNHSISDLHNKKFKVVNIKKWVFFSKKHIFDINLLSFSELKNNKMFFSLQSTLKSNLNIFYKNEKLWNLFNINFIKKEKIYTKLKYSRTPQYDIVSGGSAALFSGFLGFLICEKFGFELLDSGDFYLILMYTVFICFFFKLFLKLWNGEKEIWGFLSLKWIFYFLNLNFQLIFKFLYRNLKIKI